MPRMGFQQHPLNLAGLRQGPGPTGPIGARQAPMRAPGTPSLGADNHLLPPGIRGPSGDPGLLSGLRGGPGQAGGQNPFSGNANPGAFAQPAPFNPLLALTRFGGQMGMPKVPNMMPRGPMGGFGLAPENQRPTRKNPFQR